MNSLSKIYDFIERNAFQWAVIVVVLFFAIYTSLGLMGQVNPEAISYWNLFAVPRASTVITDTAPIQPEPQIENVAVAYAAAVNANTITQTSFEKPLRVVVPKVGIDTIVSTPTSANIPVLDQALLKGAVHYPLSGQLGEQAHVFIFGHSTTIKVVRNQAYKAFNKLKDVEVGDEVRVDGDRQSHIYRVTSVQLAKDSEARVNLGDKRRMLTLVTCNTFGAKEERVIVEAEFLYTMNVPR